VGGYLISPDGDTVGYGENQDPVSGSVGKSLTAYTQHPVSGTWTLIVDFAEPVVGNELADPYTGTIKFDAVRTSATGLPGSAKTVLPAGKPVTVDVTVTNRGAAPADIFVDPRLNTFTALQLTPATPKTVTLPLTAQFPPEWLVPSQTKAVVVTQTSSLPAMFDFQNGPGDPDIASFSGGQLCGPQALVTYAPVNIKVTPGIWFAAPSECGPYSSPAPAGTATDTATAVTKEFDPAVSTAGGDLWVDAVNPSATVTPVIIAPGATATIPVTITPSAPKGTVVSGKLYIDSLEVGIPPYGQFSGDELAGLPYQYTVG